MSPKKFWDFRETGPCSVQPNIIAHGVVMPSSLDFFPHFCAMISQTLISSKQGSFLSLVLVYASTKLIVAY